MKFSDKIKLLRNAAKLTQPELAAQAGISLRTLCHYEAGDQYPRKRETYVKLAEALNTTVDYLVTEGDGFEAEAYAQYGKRGMTQARALAEQLTGLFAGGELDEEDKDEIMQAMQTAYWQSKKINRRHIPKKYRHDTEDSGTDKK